VFSKASVITGTAGMPAFSRMMASSKLPDEQAPQSPTPAIAKSVLPLICASCESESGAR
jgi:hypothetical protein